MCTLQAKKAPVTRWDCPFLFRTVYLHTIHVKGNQPGPFLHVQQHKIILQVSLFANWQQLCNYEITAPNEIFGIGFEILSLPACLGVLCKCRKNCTLSQKILWSYPPLPGLYEQEGRLGQFFISYVNVRAWNNNGVWNCSS